MGADKPYIEKNDTKPQKSLLPILAVAAVLIFAGVLVSKLGFSGKKEIPKLSPQDEAKLEKRLKEIDESEQYALIAKVDGWYPCLHSGRTSYYLKKGEVWKYGITSKGETGRYKAPFLVKNQVFYFIQFTGTYSECLKREQINLFNYAHLPENLARPPADRLTRPPYNSIMR